MVPPVPSEVFYAFGRYIAMILNDHSNQEYCLWFKGE
jgi:hypothetical protein